MPSDKMSINDWIAKQLNKSGKTRYWLAKHAKTTPSHIDYLLDKTDPSSDLLGRLIFALAVANATSTETMRNDWWKCCHGREILWTE